MKGRGGHRVGKLIERADRGEREAVGGRGEEGGSRSGAKVGRKGDRRGERHQVGINFRQVDFEISYSS